MSNSRGGLSWFRISSPQTASHVFCSAPDARGVSGNACCQPYCFRVAALPGVGASCGSWPAFPLPSLRPSSLPPSLSPSSLSPSILPPLPLPYLPSLLPSLLPPLFLPSLILHPTSSLYFPFFFLSPVHSRLLRTSVCLPSFYTRNVGFRVPLDHIVERIPLENRERGDKSPQSVCQVSCATPNGYLSGDRKGVGRVQPAVRTGGSRWGRRVGVGVLCPETWEALLWAGERGPGADPDLRLPCPRSGALGSLCPPSPGSRPRGSQCCGITVW